MNSYSLYNADHRTHVKIVIVALAAAIVVALVGINARTIDAGSAGARFPANSSVVKAGKSVTYSARDDFTVR